ncbi:hypothetical protein SAMN04487893_104111 [Myroides guanonis]|uniref:RHS repeat-associated core domain-containing protein n=2 Tax=Myroides guanonis TaxID=1150112 RepID=A0A1I3PFV0_9FLAO|nr:hypothetical protein SAMN04487893_104111 [Myroides guanonis]
MPQWNPYSYTFNNPINFTDPTGMVPEGKEDWFVNKNTGNVVKVGGVSDLSTLSSQEVNKLQLGDVNDYNRLGKDNMFGDVGYPGVEGSLSDHKNISMNSESQNFMSQNGYYVGESLMIQEKEITSGGRVGNENYSHTVGSIKQLESLGITYAPLDKFNEKSDIQMQKFKGDNISVTTATYNYTVGFHSPTTVVNPVFQSNKKGMSNSIPLNIFKGMVEAFSDLIGAKRK